jgi:hypothetical protein
MHRWTRNAALFLAPILLLNLALLGCSSKSSKQVYDDPYTGDEEGGGKSTVKLEPIKVPADGKGTATLRGTVKVDALPDTDALTEQFRANIKQDRDYCLSAEAHEEAKRAYQWVVNKENSGVKYAFVWLRPDDSKQFFDVEELVKNNGDGKFFPKMQALDQPFCAFEPHALVLFPRYIDPKKPSTSYVSAPPTGQEFRIKNGAKITHNSALEANSSRMTRSVPNQIISPGGGVTLTEILPSYKAPVKVSCSIHPWMRAYIWAFDHPFAAVTDANGKFEIKNVPANVKLRVVGWHEEAGFFAGGEKGKVIELKPGENTENFEIKSGR